MKAFRYIGVSLLLAITSLSYALPISINNAIVENNIFIWEVISIEFREDCTIVTKKVTPKVNGTYVCSTYNEYIEDTNTHKRSYIKWSSIGFEEQQFYLYDTNPFEFTETYESMRGAKRVNIFSGTEYYIKAVNTDPFYTTYPTVNKPYNGNYCKTVITDVVISDDCTFVALDYYSYYEVGGWVSFASNITISNYDYQFSAKIMGLYVCDEDGNIVEQKNFDEKYNVNKGERNRVLLVFPRVPSGIHSVDIVEPNGFFWYGININNID